MNSNRTPGFWAEVGVVYEPERSGSGKFWRAQLPGRTDIAGYGRTRGAALSELKSAYGRANQPKDDSSRSDWPRGV